MLEPVVTHDGESEHSWLSSQEWDWIQARIPIACVDFVPVRYSRKTGLVDQVGLILRQSPFSGDSQNATDQLWCHLGGRILLGETIRIALQRHAQTTLDIDGNISFDLSDDPAVMEWFPPIMAPTADELTETQSSHGVDPRKHAVSWCFAAEIDGSASARTDGEATQFRWFTIKDTEDLNLWPGSRQLLTRVVSNCNYQVEQRRAALLAAYASISSSAINHNTLVWQTPALALAAEAFLLTLTLNPTITTAGRLIAGCLNIILSLLAFQLIEKHRQMQNRDRDVLADLEEEMKISRLHDAAPKGSFSRVGSLRSGLLWKYSFLGLAVLSVVVVILVSIPNSFINSA